MTWAPQETQISIFNVLKGDSALMALLGTTVGGAQKVFDHVPDNTAYPYITLQINPWEDRGNYTDEGLKALLSIHTWYQPDASSSFTGRGDKQVQLIQKRIDELIHKGQFPISGWRKVVLRRATINILVEPDNVTRHGVQQFNLYLGGS